MEYITSFVNTIEILGTIAFAISGAEVAIRKQMDVLGVIVLANVAAVGGGTIRDILLGNLPPSAFQNPVYVSWATATAVVMFLLSLHRWSEDAKVIFEFYVNLIDACGLGLFAVIGVRTAIQAGYQDNAFLSVFVGVLTAVGGGILRDTMAGEVPGVFRKRIYAVAALAGAWSYYMAADQLMPADGAMILGSMIVVVIRALATGFKWDLPRAKYDISAHSGGEKEGKKGNPPTEENGSR